MVRRQIHRVMQVMPMEVGIAIGNGYYNPAAWLQTTFCRFKEVFDVGDMLEYLKGANHIIFAFMRNRMFMQVFFKYVKTLLPGFRDCLFIHFQTDANRFFLPDHLQKITCSAPYFKYGLAGFNLLYRLQMFPFVSWIVIRSILLQVFIKAGVAKNTEREIIAVACAR